MGKNYVRMPELAIEKRQKSKLIAVMNNKGGCGKTTTAMALGMYLSRIGNNVLFWDNDPQCNLTQRLGLADDERKEGRLDTLFKDAEKNPDMSLIAEYPYLQRIPGSKEGTGKIGLIPGSHMSESYANSLADMYQKHGKEFQDRTHYTSIYHFFRERIAFYKKYYDYIVVDTAPALEGNILNTLALRTANDIIMPIDGLEAALGVRQLLNWMDVQTTALDHRPNGLFVMVKYQIDTKGITGDYSVDKISRNAVFSIIKNVFGDFVCDNGVRELRSLRHSTKGVPGFGGKTEYTILCDEIVKKINEKRDNIFDFSMKNGAIRDIELRLSDIERKVRKRKPKFKTPKYGVIDEE